MENSTFSTKICLKNGFRFGISKNLFQNKNQYPKDLGLKFEKTHVEIRISILEILYVCVYECMSVCMCVYVCVCVCVCMCSNFQSKQGILTFSDQIWPKMDLVLKIQKTNVAIKINILEIPFVPIFKQKRQLWLFRPKFALKWILGSEFQKSKYGFRMSTADIPCVSFFGRL